MSGDNSEEITILNNNGKINENGDENVVATKMMTVAAVIMEMERVKSMTVTITTLWETVIFLVIKANL